MMMKKTMTYDDEDDDDDNIIKTMIKTMTKMWRKTMTQHAIADSRVANWQRRRTQAFAW